MGQLYTTGDWVIKPGHEEAFRAAWERVAIWTRGRIAGSSWAFLARDTEDPLRFRSYGAWDDLGSIEAWREDPDFRTLNEAVMDHVESFDTRTYERVAEVGSPGEGDVGNPER